MKPNAGAHLLPEAGATQERTLEAVRCSALFGAAGWGGSGPKLATCPEHRGEATASIGLLLGAEWKTTHPYLPLCDTNHRTVLKGFSMLGENTL